MLCSSDSRDVMNGHRARVFAVQYHPRESHVFISGGWDDTVQVTTNYTTNSYRYYSQPFRVSSTAPHCK